MSLPVVRTRSFPEACRGIVPVWSYAGSDPVVSPAAIQGFLALARDEHAAAAVAQAVRMIPASRM
jgi:hypothetical protein